MCSIEAELACRTDSDCLRVPRFVLRRLGSPVSRLSHCHRGLRACAECDPEYKDKDDICPEGFECQGEEGRCVKKEKNKGGECVSYRDCPGLHLMSFSFLLSRVFFFAATDFPFASPIVAATGVASDA